MQTRSEPLLTQLPLSPSESSAPCRVWLRATQQVSFEVGDAYPQDGLLRMGSSPVRAPNSQASKVSARLAPPCHRSWRIMGRPSR
ncbi:hypothetical protein VTK73DRAFT_2247 [Phialemonium thermophilum]|uniref:Uncharacterized protein n=1 Tax=Phialemonium thermophilum TaxID=223376 RepID=A0ABR3VSF0_9PEZI